ncbi:1567_t:CDS:2 [Ambispora leptoticha]|uniref:1567_t:CDS:1 n=1 Tax=Ambispora leptoticha TaxID=144679 RepID=A0A9N8ZGA3_9GLOM|nr:1567_t:CDS:2 [Ambispora leptoticha]
MSQHNQRIQQRNPPPPLQQPRDQPAPIYLSMAQSFIDGVNNIFDQTTTQDQNDTLSTLFEAYQYNTQRLTTLPESATVYCFIVCNMN